MAVKSVTILCNTFPPERGAAASRLWQMAQLLLVHQFDVRVITVLPNYPTGKIFTNYRGQLWHKEEVEGIDVFRMGIYPSNSSRIMSRVLSMGTHVLSLATTGLLNLLKNKSDVIIINTPSIVNGFAGSLLSQWFTKAKVVLNVSDLYPLTALQLGAIKKGTHYNMLQTMERRMYNRADAFLLQSEEIWDHILQTPALKNKPAMIYRNLKQPSKDYANQEIIQPRKIVYAGLLGIAQGVHAICKQINFAACGTELHIYGDGNERKAIEQLITTHPHRGIYYHGSLPEDAIHQKLKGYQGILVPLIADIKGAVPSKIFMAMTYRLPILFMGNGEAAQIVREQKIGWIITPSDFHSLENAVKEFATLSAREFQLLLQALQHASENTFNKAQQDEKLIQFINQLIT